jgi:hypothetical protein
MKSRARALVVVTVAAVVILAIQIQPAQAQSQKLKVNIPFPFHVGAERLPAGTYTVARIGEAIQIDDRAGHHASILSNSAPGPTENLKTQIVFSRYGEDAFLSEVRWSGYRDARNLVKSRAELEFAKNTSSERVIMVAAR